MKKLFLMLILLIPIKVNAQTFYTDYLFKEESQKEYEESDVLKREEVIKYQNVCLKRENEGYYFYGRNPSDASKFDLNDQIIADGYTVVKTNKILGSGTTHKIKEYRTVKYIILRSFVANTAVLKNIAIYDNEQKINYSLIESNYVPEKGLNQYTQIVIDLNGEYDLRKLTVKVEFLDNDYNTIDFMLNTYYVYPYATPYYDYYTNSLLRLNKTENYTINFIYADEFDKLLPDIDWLEQQFNKDREEVHYYIYPRLKYKYYNLKKDFTDNYSIDALDGCELNYNTSKKYYLYYQRDKIEVLDTITNKEDINNLILLSTVPKDKFVIKHNIDLDHNGTYLIKINYLNNIFYKKVNVNIVKDDNLIEADKEVNNSPNNLTINKKTNKTQVTTEAKTLKVTTTNKILAKLDAKKPAQEIPKIPLFLIPLFILLTILIFKRKKKN